MAREPLNDISEAAFNKAVKHLLNSKNDEAINQITLVMMMFQGGYGVITMAEARLALKLPVACIAYREQFKEAIPGNMKPPMPTFCTNPDPHSNDVTCLLCSDYASTQGNQVPLDGSPTH